MGRGEFYKSFLEGLNLTVEKSQHDLLSQLQQQQGYKAQHGAKEKTKIQRAKKKSQYKRYEASVTGKQKEKTYQTDSNTTNKVSRKRKRSQQNHNHNDKNNNIFTPTEYDISAIETANKRRRLNSAKSS